MANGKACRINEDPSCKSNNFKNFISMKKKFNENKNSMKTKIQFHFFIHHIHSNNKLFILNIFINF